MTVLIEPAKLAALWARTRASFARLVADVLTVRALSLRQYHFMRGWVGYLERLVQKLLYAEAARLVPPPPRVSAARARETKTAPPTKAAAVSFAFALPREPRSQRRRVRYLSCHDPDLARLGRRIEALRRALADPSPLAARLARILARRTPAIRARYAVASGRPPHVDRIDPRLDIDVIGVALTAQYAFPDTS